jgi:hypothetical protein
MLGKPRRSLCRSLFIWYSGAKKNGNALDGKPSVIASAQSTEDMACNMINVAHVVAKSIKRDMSLLVIRDKQPVGKPPQSCTAGH